MRVFVDTSALYALLDEDDLNHEAAAGVFARLQGSELVTHGYVLVETLALVARRLGREAVSRLVDDLLGVVAVRIVDERLNNEALATYRASDTAGVSFVDHTSFAFMRANSIAEAFAFDADFETAGFALAV